MSQNGRDVNPLCLGGEDASPEVCAGETPIALAPQNWVTTDDTRGTFLTILETIWLQIYRTSMYMEESHLDSCRQ